MNVISRFVIEQEHRVFELVVPEPSLPKWSDDGICVLFHPMSGATHMLSNWALVVIALIADGKKTWEVLLEALKELAIDSGQEIEPTFFVCLISELVRYDFLLESSVS